MATDEPNPSPAETATKIKKAYYFDKDIIEALQARADSLPFRTTVTAVIMAFLRERLEKEGFLKKEQG